MSENYEDKDIEKLIFAGGLASGAIEPSEKFWNKAYEDIIQREKSNYLNQLSRWRSAFYFMGTATLLLGLYVIYMHNEVSDIKQQLTKIETIRVTASQQNTSQTSAATTTTEKSSIIPAASSTNTARTNSRNNGTIAIAGSNNFIGKKNFNHIIAPLNNNATTIPLVAGITSTGNNNPAEINTPAPVLTVGTNTAAATAASTTLNTTIPGAKNSTSLPGKVSAGPPATDKSITLIAGLTQTQTDLKIDPAKTPLANKKMDSAAAAISDSSNSIETPKKQTTFRGMLSRTSISAFYAPGETDDFLNDRNNDPTNTITAHILKTQQDGDGTYALGLRLAYDISNKWAIQTGAYYSQYTYNINPTIIYAQQQETGQVGYSITTSSGTVFLPNSTVPAHLGDSIKVRGNSSRGYISIPLQIKYKLIVRSRLGFYVDGGFSVNIAKNKETDIHWENTALQEGDLSIQSIYGLTTVQYSYNFGLGLEYLMGKGLSIYTEPFVDGSFTSINTNTPVITYPYFFGLAFGLTYHF